MTNTNFSCKAGRGAWSRGVLTASAGNDVDFAIKRPKLYQAVIQKEMANGSRDFQEFSHRLCYRDTAAINAFTAALQAPS